MPFAKRAGLRLHWELSGDARAPTIFLVRGLSRSSRYWYDLRPILEKSYRVLVMDNRGVGKSDAPRPGFSTIDMAEDCAAVLEDAGVERATVFGISLGGMVVQHLALRHPHRVERLVLGATRMGGKDAEPSPYPAIAVLLKAAWLSVADQIRTTTPWVLDEEHLKKRPQVIDEWISIAESEPRNRLAILGQLLAAARHDTSAHLHRVAAPTLVVTGDRDRLIPMGNSTRIAKAIAGSKLHVLPGAGHDFPTERPEEVAELISEFVNRRP
jgi:pimeloyl-ACP methyl ester carboxylesterase